MWTLRCVIFWCFDLRDLYLEDNVSKRPFTTKVRPAHPSGYFESATKIKFFSEMAKKKEEKVGGFKENSIFLIYSDLRFLVTVQRLIYPWGWPDFKRQEQATWWALSGVRFCMTWYRVLHAFVVSFARKLTIKSSKTHHKVKQNSTWSQADSQTLTYFLTVFDERFHLLCRGYFLS